MNIETEQLESTVKRYVLDQLEDQEAEEFEAYFLSRPDVADMIDSVQKINIGLERHTTSDQTVHNKVQDPVPNGSFVSLIKRFLVGPAPSFAMAAMLMVLTPLAIKGLSDGAPNLDAELVRFDSATVRSSNSNSGFDLSTDAGQAALIVRVKDVEFPLYRLSVRVPKDQRELWRSNEFAFASGSRDFLVLVPKYAAKENVNLQLIGVGEDGKEIDVHFCDYTEACF